MPKKDTVLDFLASFGRFGEQKRAQACGRSREKKQRSIPFDKKFLKKANKRPKKTYKNHEKPFKNHQKKQIPEGSEVMLFSLAQEKILRPSLLEQIVFQTCHESTLLSFAGLLKVKPLVV